MHSVRIELAKMLLVGTRITYQATEDAGSIYVITTIYFEVFLLVGRVDWDELVWAGCGFVCNQLRTSFLETRTQFGETLRLV